MRELAILTFVTLDGVMQAPADTSEDKSGNFRHSGWARPYWDDVMAQVGRTAMAEPYDLLMGRKTYDIFKGAHASEDENDPFRSSKKFVVTSSTEKLKWHNSFRVFGDLAREIIKLKSEDGPLLQVHGSWQLIQFLLAHDLIDEYRLWVFPITLGSGKRLFDENGPCRSLNLAEIEPTGNGAVMTVYRRLHESQ
jgi:dihydrofolate reductase